MKALEKLARICGGKKRVAMLLALNENLFLGCSSFQIKLAEMGLPISSSEVYKAVKPLVEFGLVERIENKFIITSKGQEFVKLLKHLLEVIK